MVDLIIRNGEVVTTDGTRRADVAIVSGKIAAIGVDLDVRAAESVDATGKLVLPGMIDPHVHMGIPIKDTFSADNFQSGSIAAACGGTTTILDFTVQSAGQSLREALDERILLAQDKSHIDYGIHVNITDQPAQRLGEIEPLIKEGFNSFKAFTTYREAGMMIEWDEFEAVLRQIERGGGFLMLHAEENRLIAADTKRNISAGHTAPIYHPRSRTAEAEAEAVRRAAEITGKIGATLYIVHLSSERGLEAGLAARRKGVNIILETCPQYLLLDESCYLQPNGHWYITTPPMRKSADCEALWQAVANGDIDTIGTDHCPFTIAQKDRYGDTFHLTPNGMPGVEQRFPLLYSYGVRTGRISLEKMVDLLATNVARIFAIDDHKGSLAVGMDADVVVWEPDEEGVISAETQHGNADWSPYEGMRIFGRNELTLLRGQPIVKNGEFIGRNVWGQLLRTKSTL